MVSSCFAQEISLTGTPTEIFRTISNNVIDKVIANEVHEIGSLNMVDLKKELNQVEYALMPYGFLMGSGGRRSTSIYFVEHKRVIINEMSLQQAVGRSNILAWTLHEAFGALGYLDENYELSLPLFFLSQAKDSTEVESQIKIFSPLFQKIEKRTQEAHYSMEGGVTAVGGGGQIEIINFKQRLIEMTREWIEFRNGEIPDSKYEQIVRNILQVPMEMIETNDGASIENGIILVPSLLMSYATNEELMEFFNKIEALIVK